MEYLELLEKVDTADLVKIKFLTRKNPTLQKKFIKFHVEEKVPVEGDDKYWNSLSGMFKYISQHKQQLNNHLQKNIVEYEKFEYLADGIRSIQDRVRVKKEFIDELPSKLKGVKIGDLSQEQISTIIGYLDSDKKLFRPKEISKNINELIDYIGKRVVEIQQQTGNSFQNELREWNGKFGVDLVYDERNILVLKNLN